MRDFPPIHPDEILLEEFLKPMEISPSRLANDINTISQLLKLIPLNTVSLKMLNTRPHLRHL
jgi:plasmid maintenance system antidote protein VapI